jgi:hypothetical protein
MLNFYGYFEGIDGTLYKNRKTMKRQAFITAMVKYS